MERAHQVINNDGLQIPLPFMQQYGLQPGSHVTLEFESDMIRVVPQSLSREEIENRALLLLLHHLGDALLVTVSPSTSHVGVWQVAVSARGITEPLGCLEYASNGKLLSDLPAALAEIRENAARLAAAQ